VRGMKGCKFESTYVRRSDESVGGGVGVVSASEVSVVGSDDWGQSEGEKGVSFSSTESRDTGSK
jgi:hypothetical protein